MSKGKKIIFVLFLLIFISAPVYMSFNMISRPTYEFKYTEACGSGSNPGRNICRRQR